MKFKASAWTNGKVNHTTGSGFGLRIPKEYRKAIFEKDWHFVHIKPPGIDKFEVKIHPSFWDKCHELRSIEIGQWLISNGLNKWEKRKPHKIDLEYVGNKTFNLIPASTK